MLAEVWDFTPEELGLLEEAWAARDSSPLREPRPPTQLPPKQTLRGCICEINKSAPNATVWFPVNGEYGSMGMLPREVPATMERWESHGITIRQNTGAHDGPAINKAGPTAAVPTWMRAGVEISSDSGGAKVDTRGGANLRMLRSMIQVNDWCTAWAIGRCEAKGCTRLHAFPAY